MAALSNYLENKMIDFLFRGQAFTPATTLYVGLFTATPAASGGGTEITGGSYARVAVTSSLANWAGTQGAGSTAVSSGTTGTTSNNATITYPAPTANWGTATSFATFDASSAGNMYYFANLTSNQTISSGNAAPTFAAAALSFTNT